MLYAIFTDNRQASYPLLEICSEAAERGGNRGRREGGRGGAQSVSILRHGPNMLHFLFLTFSLFLPREGQFFTFL